MLKSGMTAIRSDIQPELIEFLSVLDIYEPCPDPEIPVSGRPKLARLVPKYSRMSRLRCPLRSQSAEDGKQAIGGIEGKIGVVGRKAWTLR